MADHEPVKQHPQRREMLFHGRLGKPCPAVPLRSPQHFNVCGDVRRFHVGQAENRHAAL
jgi:hypothetical protein